MGDRETPSTSWAVWAWQAYRDGRLVEAPAADARAEALLKRAAQMAYEVWDDPEALSKAILALIPEAKP